MRTLSLLTICCLLLGFPATAQLNYTFKAATAAYTPLSGATSATGGKLWDANSTFTLPLGFSFKFNGTSVQTMYMNGSLLHPAMTGAKQSGLLPLSTSLIDRGTIQGKPLSEVRYSTSGSAGSRIFKLELANAGFENEMDIDQSLKDSVNVQIWLYEGTNAIEYHFGPSGIRHFNDYFDGRMLSGYVRDLDTLAGTFATLHFLNGTAAAPSLDSSTSFPMAKGLSSFPASGQVYRFVPKGANTNGVEKVSARSLATICPTRCRNSIQIRNTSGLPLHTSIYDMDGRLALQLEVRSEDCQLDLSRMPAGIYIVQLTDMINGLTESQRVEKL